MKYFSYMYLLLYVSIIFPNDLPTRSLEVGLKILIEQEVNIRFLLENSPRRKSVFNTRSCFEIRLCMCTIVVYVRRYYVAVIYIG